MTGEGSTGPRHRAEGRRALWVVGTGELAGVGRHVLDVVDTGIPGWDLAVLSPPGPLRDALRVRGVSVDTPHRFSRFTGSLPAVRAVREAARATSPALVHSHLAWADLVSVTALTGVPLVSTEHGISGDPGTYSEGRVDRLATATAHRARMRRTDTVVCVSSATAATVRRRWRPPPRTRLPVVYNGIEPRAARASSTHRVPVVGYLGRLAPEKRVHLVLRAFAAASRETGAILAIAGDGPERDALVRLARNLSISDRVRFDGWVDSRAWLREVDVLALASVWENCPYAVLESMSEGVGVVAAPVGGTVELLPGRCLVDPADPHAFARQIVDQLLNPQARPTLPSWIPSLPEMTASVAAVYDAAVGGSR